MNTDRKRTKDNAKSLQAFCVKPVPVTNKLEPIKWQGIRQIEKSFGDKSLHYNSNKILKHRYVNKSVSKLSPLRNELVEEIESKRQTQQNFLSNKELVGEFQIKDQNDISKILNINCETSSNNQTYGKLPEIETPMNVTSRTNNNKFPDLTIFGKNSKKPEMRSVLGHTILERANKKKYKKRRNNSQPSVVLQEEIQTSHLELEVQVEYLKHVIRGLKKDLK